jgi:dTDP-4-amino-4,6-dideoxygalactose transaminase
MMDRVPVFAFVHDAGLEQALADAAHRVLSSARYVLGEEVAAFEREFADYCGTSHCVGVANGTDALELALRAAGVERGDRVATVANAGYYTCAALAAIGAEPVFVDVDDTLTMSPEALDAVAASVKAIVVTHLYGRLAAIEAICAIAEARRMLVIEDCAQAHGALHEGRRAGSFGVAGCFSFYPTKNLGAIGDAGAIVTSNSDVAARARALRQYGWSAQYEVTMPGGRNSRLDELQAAFLRVKLPRLGDVIAARVAIARRYCEGLRAADVIVPQWHGGDYVAHLFVIRARDRDALRERLNEAGIDTAVHYPIPDHLQRIRPSARGFDLPMTKAACRQVLTLPCYPGLAVESVDRVIDVVRRHLSKGALHGEVL